MNKVGYELFLPAMAARFREKRKHKHSLTDEEFKAIVRVTFRDAVIQFMKESQLFRIEVPLDIYKNVMYYPLVAPDGYYIESALTLMAGRAEVPPYYDLTEDALDISGCCPEYDINRGLYVEAAIVPYRSGTDCKFDEKFLNKYYDAILVLMEYMFAKMDQQPWTSKSVLQLMKQEYIKLRKKAIRGGSDSNRPMTLSYRGVLENGLQLREKRHTQCYTCSRHRVKC